MPESFIPIKTPILIEATNLPLPPTEALVHFTPAEDATTPVSPIGAVGEIILLIEQAQPVLLVSLGKAAKINADTWRQAGGKLADWLLKHEITSAWIKSSDFGEIGLTPFAEGLLLNAFRFNRYKKAEKEPTPKKVLVQCESDFAAVDQTLSRTKILINAVNLQRDWAHEPANQINPVTLAERAAEIAQVLGIKCTILDDNTLKAMGAGAITAVGKGSSTPSRLIVFEYPGKGKGVGQPPVAVVGKAITFDTGGYSLKDVTAIQTMKYDKCGGLNVIAIMKAAVELGIETPLVGVICAAENMISGGAYRPDDILTSLSGKTIEIITTDAEGRLVLADGLTYTQKTFKPRAVIDMATLTGGVVVALGRVRAGLLSNNDQLAEDLFNAGEAVHERLWRLPLDEDYVNQIKGDDADIKNSGGKEAHPVIGGIFLQQFVEDDKPWAHLDIAGVADTPRELPYSQKGATGFGIRLIIKYLEGLQ